MNTENDGFIGWAGLTFYWLNFNLFFFLTVVDALTRKTNPVAALIDNTSDGESVLVSKKTK